jgi:adenylyltransferase/sulfurtransferase
MHSRFTTLKNHSEKDQDKLGKSTAAVVGLGATGSAIAENLARHGTKLIIIDRDYLEEKDTYSSSIYTPKQAEKSLPKSEAAKKYLQKFTEVKSHVENLSAENIKLVESADIILDGTDNLETRQLINDFSKKEDIPWIYTAAIAEKAYSMPFIDKCFNCMVQRPEKIATCETEGIMREIAQQAAAKSVEKAVKILTGKNVCENLEIIHEGRSLAFESSKCEVCQKKAFPHLKNVSTTETVCGKNKYQLKKKLTDENFQRIVETCDIQSENDFLVKTCYEGYQITFFKSGRIIAEAEDSGHAEALISEVAGI